MNTERFYSLVRRKLGLQKQQMKQEVREEVTEELRNEFGQEISYIEAQMKEYEQLVAEVNHLLSTMRKQGMQDTEVEMDGLGADSQPLKSKLKQLEESMKNRVEEQQAYL